MANRNQNCLTCIKQMITKLNSDDVKRIRRYTAELLNGRSRAERHAGAEMRLGEATPLLRGAYDELGDPGFGGR